MILLTPGTSRSNQVKMYDTFSMISNFIFILFSLSFLKIILLTQIFSLFFAKASHISFPSWTELCVPMPESG